MFSHYPYDAFFSTWSRLSSSCSSSFLLTLLRFIIIIIILIIVIIISQFTDSEYAEESVGNAGDDEEGAASDLETFAGLELDDDDDEADLENIGEANRAHRVFRDPIPADLAPKQTRSPLSKTSIQVPK